MPRMLGMAEFDKVTVEQFGKRKILDLPPGEYEPFESSGLIIRVYREPPHVEKINSDGLTETYTPRDKKHEFKFGKNLISWLSDLAVDGGYIDETVLVVYSSSTETVAGT